MNKFRYLFFDFILKEWLLIASALGFVLTSIYTGNLPHYSIQELEVLFILFSLFVTVKGLENSGLILRISQNIERGKAAPLKLVVATFFLSMLITNDAALIVIVPLTLAIKIKRMDVLVILEALAANAGSALTPFGNPQNLFIYWFFGLTPAEFIAAIAPFSFIFFVLLVISSSFIKTNNSNQSSSKTATIEKSSYIYGILLIIALLTVLRLLPVSAGIVIILYALLFDRKSLRIDYALLFVFFFFFGVAENLKIILGSDIRHAGHIFLFSALASQIMSNVPAALLFAKFTIYWKALLWGTNAGGFGSILGSLANLIAYKLYIANNSTNKQLSFTAKFLTFGYIAFFISLGLYFVLNRV